MTVNNDVDRSKELSHDAEIQMPQVSFGRGGKPREDTGYHDQADKEERHDVDAGNDTEFTQDGDVGGEQCQESDRNGQVGEESGEPHFFYNGGNRVQLILGPCELEV